MQVIKDSSGAVQPLTTHNRCSCPLKICGGQVGTSENRDQAVQGEGQGGQGHQDL